MYFPLYKKDPLKLFMLLLGCKPPGRHTEQHDIFFGIANAMGELVTAIKQSWKEANGNIHVDAWREVTKVDGYTVEVLNKQDHTTETPAAKLFFINLGGYKENQFDEFHYKMIIACGDKGEAVKRSKETAFYKHTGFRGATSHIDDKYGVDVDDLYEIEDILPEDMKAQYSIILSPTADTKQDEFHLGYFQLHKL